MSAEFKPWDKIPRGGVENVCITEKIDGTNGCIIIEEDEYGKTDSIIGVQSRKRLITPGKDTDNFGFAQWVENNAEDLLTLGPGYHYGEWSGEGIQKNPHGMTGRHFLLFNSARWNDDNPNRPDCCGVVPVLYSGVTTPYIIEKVMDDLHQQYVDLNLVNGTSNRPEGVIVWYSKTRRFEKYTFENQGGKWTA